MTRQIDVTPEEEAWLALYRANPEISTCLRSKWTGQIALNVHDGHLGTGDVRVHFRLKATAK